MVSSYNGWTASKSRSAIGVGKFVVNGVEFVGGVKQGPVAEVLGYVMAQFDKRVEKLKNPGCWGHNFRPNRNANNLSCHSSGTAVDANAPKHPNGRYPTFTARQITEIRHILAEVDHVVRWGGDFHGTKDTMHFEIVGNLAAVQRVAKKIQAHHAAAAKAGPQARIQKREAAKPLGTPVDKVLLHVGMKGTTVKTAQQLLIKHGIHVVADGDFGHGTERGVMAFQRSKRMTPDGKIGPKTWAALRK